jgi:hypothetical protein
MLVRRQLLQFARRAEELRMLSERLSDLSGAGGRRGRPPRALGGSLLIVSCVLVGTSGSFVRFEHFERTLNEKRALTACIAGVRTREQCLVLKIVWYLELDT